MKRFLKFETEIQKIHSFPSFWKGGSFKNTSVFKSIYQICSKWWMTIITKLHLLNNYFLSEYEKQNSVCNAVAQWIEWTVFFLERHWAQQQTFGIPGWFLSLQHQVSVHLQLTELPPASFFSSENGENSEIKYARSLFQNLAHGKNSGIAIVTLQLPLGNDL